MKTKSSKRPGVTEYQRLVRQNVGYANADWERFGNEYVTSLGMLETDMETYAFCTATPQTARQFHRLIESLGYVVISVEGQYHVVSPTVLEVLEKFQHFIS